MHDVHCSGARKAGRPITNDCTPPSLPPKLSFSFLFYRSAGGIMLLCGLHPPSCCSAWEKNNMLTNSRCWGPWCQHPPPLGKLLFKQAEAAQQAAAAAKQAARQARGGPSCRYPRWRQAAGPGGHRFRPPPEHQHCQLLISGAFSVLLTALHCARSVCEDSGAHS